jgi:hypothetical protein
MVVKRSGVTEPFSRTKIINGVRKRVRDGLSPGMRSPSSASGSRRRCGPPEAPS